MRTEAEISATAKDGRAFSNGTEFDIWAGRYCYECVHDDAAQDLFCPILSVALLGQWPAEWTRRTHHWKIGESSGSYEVVDACTEFEDRRDDDGPDDDEPGPIGPFDQEMSGQTDIFEVFVEQGLAELSEQRVAVAR